MKLPRVGIAVRLMSVFLLIIYVPMTATMLLLIRFLTNYETGRYQDAMTHVLELVEFRIEERIESCMQSAVVLASDKITAHALMNPFKSDLEMVTTTLDDLAPAMQNVRLQNSYIAKIRLLHAKDDMPKNYYSVNYDPSIQNRNWSDWLKNTENYGQDKFYKNVYVGGINNEYIGFLDADRSMSDYFSVFSPIYSNKNFQVVGVYEVDILMDSLLEPCKSIDISNSGVLMVKDRSGRALYSSDPDFNDGAVSLEPDSARFTMLSRDINYLNAELVFYLPKPTIRSNNYIRTVLFVSIALFFVLTLVVTLTSKLFTSKIVRLEYAVKQFEQGNLEAKAPVMSNDEIGELATQFNSMTGRISELIKNNEIAARAEKDAIYKALENQIKPHFLCNALDFVRMTAEVENNEVISDSISRIMGYLNYNIGNRHRFVLLCSEIANVNDYISIYNLIHPQRITCSTYIDDSLKPFLEKIRLPKFTLQPIADNCIKHGFAQRQSGCVIQMDLSVETDAAGIKFVAIGIEDNGQGMEKERLQYLLKRIRECMPGEETDITSSGIGLINIYQRLKLVYGDLCLMSIESYNQVGTLVTIKFPLDYIEIADE